MYIERTAWHDEGFASKPEEKEADGGEVLYRAYGGTSGHWGNCFFVPAIDSVPINYWTAELLEQELNAALWGNEFDGVIKFQILNKRPAVRYKIGPVAHDLYAGVEIDRSTTPATISPFVQRSFLTPSGIFKQVTIIKPPEDPLDAYVRMIGPPTPIGSGRFSREMASRAKKFKQ
jgi:hypothetical protein